MLKRKYGDRSGWKRVIDRQYAQSFIDTKEFRGYITLLKTIKVSEPLYVNYDGKEVCIVDDGNTWLQQFPLEKNHSVTTMFDPQGNIVQWYIDICKENGIENNVPWMDDLFLDLVVLPTGEIFEQDIDEIEEAFSNQLIDKHLYDLAWNEMKTLKGKIINQNFELLKLSHHHKEILEKKLS